MEKSEYQRIFDLEDRYWWYVGLHRLVKKVLLKEFDSSSPYRLLDAGCGTGGLLSQVGNTRSFGLEKSLYALPFLRQRQIHSVACGSVVKIPFPDASFEAVVSMDVLYHVEVDNDQTALQEFYRVLKPGGCLILNLPAFEFLRSHHDRIIFTKRRYQKKGLCQLLERSKFKVDRISYRNTFLFPIAAGVRIFRKNRNVQEEESDLRPLPFWINAFLAAFLGFENRLLLKGIRFPFGLSLFCVARKPG